VGFWIQIKGHDQFLPPFFISNGIVEKYIQTEEEYKCD